MSNDNPDYLHLTSKKFVITCRTCGVTESFYSELSVGYFRLKHAGHDVVEGSPKPKPREEVQAPVDVNKETVETAPPMEPEPPNEPEPAREAPVEAPVGRVETAVQVERVVVEAKPSAVDGSPVVEVRGLRADGKDPFVLIFKLEEAAKMREFLGSGRYEDEAAGNLVYTWDPDAVHFEWNRAEKLAPPEKGEPEPPMPPEPLEQPFVPSPDSVASSVESMVTEVPADSVASSMEEMIAEVPAEPEKPQEVAPAEAEKPPEVAPAPVLKRSRRPRRPRAKVTRPKEKPAPEAVPVLAPPIAIPLPEKKEEETLLLAKSSYIQEGQANRREAVRISKILKAFRWNVEPVYTIGVILDDNMSIETNKSEISASLIRQIEIAGYKLSAVTATSGKPTAWFKRKPSLDLPAPTPPAESAAQLRGKVEELSRTLQEERQRAEEQKALWEARFVQLMRLVEIKKSEETETVAGNDASEPQPEPDVAS